MVRRFLIIAILLFVVAVGSFAKSPKKGLINGFDGGMMLHTGYLQGNIASINYLAKGAPFGIGGVIRLHIGEYLRFGTEGYMSQLNELGNGSYIKLGWGGLLADYSMSFEKFSLFAGATFGAGAATTLLMFEEPSSSWSHIDGTIYNKQSFFAIDPFLGCEYALNKSMRFTLKFDWLNPITSASSTIPSGPRAYFGFIFSH